MGRLTKDLKDDEILRFHRFNNTMSAAGVYTQISSDTNLSIDRGLIWLVHFIELEIMGSSVEMPAAGATESVQLQITRESKSGIIEYQDADLIEKIRIERNRGAAIGTDTGPLEIMTRSPHLFNYAPPIAYANQTIFIGLTATHASALSIAGRIGYTLRRVTDKFFYRVAQALIS